MDKYEQLADAIVEYELIGYYDLIDAYGSEREAFRCISNDLRNNPIDVSYYEEMLKYEQPNDDEVVILNRILDLAAAIN